jgi:hypothetical protein
VCVRHALAELYEWYRAQGDELFPIYRDATTLPPSTQAARREENRQLGDALVAGFAGADERGRSLRAVAHLQAARDAIGHWLIGYSSG